MEVRPEEEEVDWSTLLIPYNDTVLLVSENLTKYNLTVAEVVAHEYNCCAANEGTWTAFFCVLFSAILFAIAIIKYLRKQSLNPHVVRMNWKKISKVMYAEEDKAIGAIPTKPMDSKDLPRICSQHRRYPILYKVEFQMASKVEPHSLRHALKEANELKNTNKRSIAYDYNRVVLDPLPDSPDSDYVNASYVDSLLTPKAYVATQGPLENTICDFWRLVWQQKSRIIVMLTKTFDFIKVMCVQYWPAMVGCPDHYEGIKVDLLKEEQLANFQIRTLKLSLEGHPEEEREIVQFHYTEWPSHTQPFINGLLEFRRRIKLWTQANLTPADGPIIVHCSDGGARTGVYMAVDANLELHEEDGKFDIYGYVKRLKQARPGLIETVNQYRFVYDALEEFLLCGYSFFPVSELSQRLKHKSMKINGNKSEYQIEFEKICKMTPRFTIGDCAGGHRADNRVKNRNVLCVPPDNFRPYITSFQGNSNTDYINAVCVDGYLRPREYIVSEWPLKSTTSDFWSLVYDHEVTSVVVLCNPSPLEASHYPPFWPDKQKSMKYGPVFTIDHTSHQHYQNIRSWVFKISKKIIFPQRTRLATVVDEVQGKNIVSLTELMAGIKAEPKTCHLFQLMCWPQGHKVPTSTNALVELMNMVERWRQRTGYGPVVVVSPDGMSRAGVYCAANACIEQVIQHGEVDVFQAVHTVRRHRPQLTNNMTEYKYCYDLVLHYVLHFLSKEVVWRKHGSCVGLL
ncbi:receptor-type tyrosine-protein phosphatase kappa-like isoform X3 [Homarus americanus]|uniref:receptor-type tyrosine-protein phosphatase kappa-like isoform X3 n=1 Tax=Homarus americanus TaxID=6706 RepID=UPI001C471EDD|nr:receptor-type tyrosine-protein phosphatase kappa-like isoform X3 [Homarus americanus]